MSGSNYYPNPYIGNARFNYPLRWKSKATSSVKIGSDIRTLDGSLIMIRCAPATHPAAPVEVCLTFSWESYDTVNALDTMWKSGQEYTADFEGDGHQFRFVFAAENGVTAVKSTAFGDEAVAAQLKGWATDLWDGEVNLFIVSGL
jgi:hypothetical protein